MTDPRKRSREENILEMRRLQKLYNSLPPDKRAAQEAHLRRRMQELSEAVSGGARSARSGGGGFVDALSRSMVWIIVALAVLGLGFFGMMTYARL